MPGKIWPFRVHLPLNGHLSGIWSWQPWYKRSHRERNLRKCRYTWHSTGMGWPFPMLNILIYFSNKIYRSNFIKQHSETLMVWNYQNADCSLKKKFIVSFITIFGILSFPTDAEFRQTSIAPTPRNPIFEVGGPIFWSGVLLHFSRKNFFRQVYPVWRSLLPPPDPHQKAT